MGIKHVVVSVMSESDLFLWFLCGCYFIGGTTIGYYFTKWRNNRRNNKTGSGRWDYKDRHLGDGSFRE
tara:strand:+ start:7895 stop:8098 length:204 start_codon:yes stop_codon:yes gene_type:complete